MTGTNKWKNLSWFWFYISNYLFDRNLLNYLFNLDMTWLLLIWSRLIIDNIDISIDLPSTSIEYFWTCWNTCSCTRTHIFIRVLFFFHLIPLSCLCCNNDSGFRVEPNIQTQCLWFPGSLQSQSVTQHVSKVLRPRTQPALFSFSASNFSPSMLLPLPLFHEWTGSVQDFLWKWAN